MRKFNKNAQFRQNLRQIAQNSVETAFLQHFHARNLGEITVFCAVLVIIKSRGIFVSRPSICRKFDSYFWLLRKENKEVKADFKGNL